MKSNQLLGIGLLVSDYLLSEATMIQMRLNLER